jgi:hypothetical protein
MTDTIICTPVLQPHAYSCNPSKYSVAVSLNFAYRASSYSPSPSENHAREHFEAFLKTVRKARFRVYRPARSASSPPQYLEPAEWTVSEEHLPSGATSSDNIMAWLDSRGKTAKSQHYWVSADPPTPSSPDSNYSVRVKHNDLEATHFLGAAAAWPAPLAQNAGLVRILTLTPMVASPHVLSQPVGSPPTDEQHDLSHLIIVPFFDDVRDFNPQNFTHIHYPETPDSHDLIRFTYDAGAGFSEATAEVRFVDADAMKATGLMDIDNGFLVAPKDTEEVADILKRIENRSASLFWAFPAVQAIKWKDAPDHSSPAPAMSRLVWRAMNGLATLLDPVVLSLVMPPPGDPVDRATPNPDGPFVSALAACISEAWKDQPSPTPDTSGLTKVVEQGLLSSLILTNENNPDTKERGSVVALLIDSAGVKFRPDDKFDIRDDPAATVKKAPNFVWLLMQYYAAVPPNRLATDHFDEFIKSATDRFGSGGDPATLEAALSNELWGLAQQLQADDNIEQLVLRLLTKVKLFDKGELARRLGIHDVEDRIGNTAIPNFRTFITRNFNALDAVRHAQARLYELHLVTEAAARKRKAGGGAVEPWSAEDLKKVINETQWFVRRMDSGAGGTFDRIGRVVPIYADSALTRDDHGFVTRTLKVAFAPVGNELLPPKGEQRFVPDAAPQSLQVQSGVDSDLRHLEDFAHAYSGLGVLVRRAGWEKWAYANLAELKIHPAKTEGEYQDVTDPAHPGSPGHNLITVTPLQPVAIDQQYRLFLQYDGLPFTSQAFADTHAPGAADDLRSFFKFDDPEGDNLRHAGFALLPPLAYGTTYGVSTFVVGKGGALPRSAQADSAPWLPSHTPHIPADADGKTYARSYNYQRTTAVGRVTINESGPKKRIGAGIDGVQPLFRDYPRVGLGAAPAESCVLDILRNADGTGAFRLPQPGTAFSPPLFSPPQPGKTTSITLLDLWWWGGKGELTISVFARPDVFPTDSADPAWTFAVDGAFAGASLTLEVFRADGGLDPLFTFTCHLSDAPTARLTSEETQTISAARLSGVASASPSTASVPESIWLRLKILSSATHTSPPIEPIALSFADPTAAGGIHVSSRPPADSLVLLAPPTAEWRPQYVEQVKANVIFPRVGFNDFDRWLNNDQLADQAKTSKRGDRPSQDDLTRFDKFRHMLMTAYVGRHLDQKLGPLVDSPPDLSVDQLLVELTPLDALYAKPKDVVSDTHKINAISQILPLKTLGAHLVSLRPRPAGSPDEPDLSTIIEDLTALSNLCSASLVINSSDHGKLSIGLDKAAQKPQTLTATVPRGMVARLTIRPMVHEHYVEHHASPPGITIFDERMATLATEKRGHYYVFEGASLVIESMLGALAAEPSSPHGLWQTGIARDTNRSYDWENLVAKAVAVRPAGVHRSYDLVAQPGELKTKAEHWWWWRQLANIDVETQRWRFTGRPIYSWLNPQKNLKGPAAGAGIEQTGSPPEVAIKPTVAPLTAAIQQTWSDDDNSKRLDEIAQFEKEIFFDRDDADADIRNAQLSPAPYETVLQSFPWEQPSATYFRHRLTIHSRYEGALKTGQIAFLRAWGEDSDFKDNDLRKQRFGRSWIRVAMLADRTRLQLTRPQLRALIPLTVAPATDDETPAATPPVMAILDERPFAHGGLADRIGAEIRTGFGYELPGSPAILQIADARKEVGPDPRLTYMPTPENEAQALTLRNEGPVGLTFDTDNVRAAVFANTALVLHPMLLTAKGAPPASLEEHFLSVGLRRYLDPTWLVSEGGNRQPIDDCWLMTSRITATEASHSPPMHERFNLGVKGTAGSRDLIRVIEQDHHWTVWFDAALIDPPTRSDVWASPPGSSPELSPAPNFKELCAMDRRFISGLAFLHLPLEKGRASLSVFALPADTSATLGDMGILAGDANQPLMMGSIEWQVPAGATDVWVEHDGTAEPYTGLTSAGPTTLMNWTRTGRNFELWNATKDGELKLYKVSDVVARWANENKTACAFYDARDSRGDAHTKPQPLSFEPPRSRDSSPLYVHRHHAIIATKNAPGFGRPVEVYAGGTSVPAVRRMFGAPFPLPRDTQAVRLIEFETPARPLAWFSSAQIDKALAEFKTARFDLISIWANVSGSYGSPATHGFSVFIRPLGDDATNRALTELTLQVRVLLSRSDGAPDATSVRLRPKPPAHQPAAQQPPPAQPPPHQPVRGIVLTARDLGRHIDVAGKFFYVGGEVRDAVVTPAGPFRGPNSKMTQPALELTSISMDGLGGAPPEFWTDVSLLMLPTSGDDTDTFDFDWFFTGGDAESAADAIKEDALRDMVEAQARIIAVSPPIRVESA